MCSEEPPRAALLTPALKEAEPSSSNSCLSLTIWDDVAEALATAYGVAAEWAPQKPLAHKGGSTRMDKHLFDRVNSTNEAEQ